MDKYLLYIEAKLTLNKKDDKEIHSDYPFVSIIILNYNGRSILGRDFDRYIHSVMQTEYPQFELIFVDNGSRDDSLDYVKNSFVSYPNFKTFTTGKNLGFAKGNNIGIANVHQQAEYVALVNNDIEVERSWLRNLVDELKRDYSVGIVQPKILKESDRKTIDSTGGFIDREGRSYDRGSKEIDIGQYNESTDIFYAKGAAILVRKKLFDEIGLLDDDYFLYYEDTDFCWRAQLIGYKVLFVPSSIVYHRGSATLGGKFDENILYIIRRNQMVTLIKNYEFENLMRYLSLYVVKCLVYSFRLIISGRIKKVRSILRSIFWNIENLNKTFKKRRQVQSLRRVPDKVILDKLLTTREYESLKTLSELYE